ncbi:hypothetical protein ACOYW6_12790 [Parablastomonas sp. CN1-191]|uniref:hypothetical protein n=1 Tax=Parablastomonas sp. CN1-191 TaxID=3400908 RepID=UPI003BF8CEC1
MALKTDWMRSSAKLALAIIAMLAISAETMGQTSIPPCPATFAKLFSDEVFRAHAVHIAQKTGKPHPPNVKKGRAHLYRTVIREGAKLGPDFADHYTIIRIGCGAATTCLAIADAENGNVYFPPELTSVEALLVDTGKMDIDALNYRRDSRLLIVVGSPNEERRQAGISYYIWRSSKLRLLRFLPAAKLCGLPASTQF